MEWTDIVAVVVSVAALIISILQFFVERLRSRREATINALAELQKEVLNNSKYTELDANEVVKEHMAKKDGDADYDWETASEFLARIEQFAVGINTGVYAVSVLDRMAGSHMIKEYQRVEPIISYKRKKAGTDKRYIEFETMVNKLKKYNPDIKTH